MERTQARNRKTEARGAPRPSAAERVRLARLFHALSDPTRIEIVERLLSGEHCVCDLTDHLDAAQSRLSFHLKTLKDEGIVTDRREGRWVYYTLDRRAFEKVRGAVAAILDRVARPGPGCCGG